MLELLTIIIELLLIPVLYIVAKYGLMFFLTCMTFIHPEISDDKIKYISQMVSKDKDITMKK